MGFFPESAIASKPRVKKFAQCGACGLYKDCLSPKMPVSGSGDLKILMVGEAPGRQEDKRGEAFVGKAGQELLGMCSSVGFRLRHCWLTNSLICRPENNATPTSDQIKYCRPNLMKTIKELNPDVIVPLGATAIHSSSVTCGRKNLDQ